MQKRLPKLLSLVLDRGGATKGTLERKRMLASERFCEEAGLNEPTWIGEDQFKSLEFTTDEHGIKPNSKLTKKELLKATTIETTTLLQEEVLRTVQEGAEPARCFRDILPLTNINSYSLRVVKGEAGRYAELIPEGSIFTQKTQNYTKVDIAVNKYGEMPVITNEMVDDCLFDIIDLELRKAGAAVENRLNRECLGELLTDCTTTTAISPAGTHIAVSDIAKAIADVQAINRYPNVLVTHPTAQGYLLQDSNLVYVAYAGQDRTLKTGQLPTLLGLRPYNSTITDAAGIWGNTTAGTNVSALILDTTAPVAMIAMRDDISVGQYEDPIHDLQQIIVKMRFGVDTIFPEAGIKIYHK